MDAVSSINLSSVDDKEEQQFVTLVDASEIGESDPLDFSRILDSNQKKSSFSSQSNGHHCLICNGKLVVSARGALNIFNSEIRTSKRNMDLNDILVNILDRELKVSNIHSSLICKKCFKLIDYIDCVEEQLADMKKEIVKKFLCTEAFIKNLYNNSYNNLVVDPDQITSYATVANGDKTYKIHPIKNNIKRGRRGRGRKVTNTPALVKLEVQEESDDILSSCLSIEDGNSDNEEFRENEETDQEEFEIHNNTKKDEMNIYEVDGLDILNNEKFILIGDTVVPKINNAADFHGAIPDENGGKFRCRFCKLRRQSYKSIESHLYKFHADKLLECELCKEISEDKNQFLNHLNQHLSSGDKPFICNHCSRTFALPRLLQEHLRRHFNGKPLACYICPKIFRRESALETHLITHTGSKPYVCELCPKRFSTKPILKAHTKIHSVRNRSFQCHICKKMFLTSHHLNDHIQIHQNDKEFLCSFCDKCCSTQRNLDLHMIIHSGVKNFCCRICNKAFARKGEVEDHERIHTGEKPFQCEICGAQFCQRSNLLTHKRSTHLKEKRYECNQCTKAFKRRRLLVYHVQSIHTGERPYKCNFCKAAFVYPEHFKKHLRIHSGEKPFKCEVCGKAFNSRDNKNAHKFIHSDKKQYECTLCGNGFMRKPQLVSHIRQHGIENEEPYIKVNSASIVDSEIENELSSNNMEPTMQPFQLVHSENNNDVQVMNRPIIVSSDGISRYILPNQIVEVRDEDLDELTSSQLNHIAEVTQHAESSSDPSIDSSLQIHETDDEYFHIQLDEVAKIPQVSQASVSVTNPVKQTRSNSNTMRRLQVSLMPGTFKKLTQSHNTTTGKSKNWNS